jgi:hypothetical protein
MHTGPQAQHFAAPWGRALKLVSAGVTVGLLAATVVGWMFLPASAGWARAVLIALPLALVLGAPLFVVRGYTLDRGQLVILRPGWCVRLPLRGLREAVPDGGALCGSLRLCGNGGLFSITGWYWNRRLGRYRAFVNDVNRVVVLRWPDRVVVVSPDDPERFARAVLAQAAQV